MKSNYGSTNASPGYAKVSQYGSNGIKAIIPPTPATLNPSVLAVLKPHSVASMMPQTSGMTSSPGYVTLGSLCRK